MVLALVRRLFDLEKRYMGELEMPISQGYHDSHVIRWYDEGISPE